MDFFKKNYEKVLLGIVLVGLAVGTGFLPIMIANERQNLVEMRMGLIPRQIKPLEEPDLTLQKAVFKRVETPLELDLSSTNRLFNPVPWVKTSDGRIIKEEESNIGPKAVVVTDISPLYTIIKLDSVQVTDSGVRYMMGVERQAAPTPSQRRNRGYLAVLNGKNDAFTIREVRGPPEAPTALVLEMNDTGEQAIVTKDQPFKREDGYTADLKYEPEKKTWNNVRVGSGGLGTLPIIINGEGYIVVAITKDEVVLSARSNNKKTPISYSPSRDQS